MKSDIFSSEFGASSFRIFSLLLASFTYRFCSDACMKLMKKADHFFNQSLFLYCLLLCWNISTKTIKKLKTAIAIKMLTNMVPIWYLNLGSQIHSVNNGMKYMHVKMKNSLTFSLKLSYFVFIGLCLRLKPKLNMGINVYANICGTTWFWRNTVIRE